SRDSQVNPSPPFSQSTPSWRPTFSSPTFHLSDLMNWTTHTRQPRATPRITTPKAAVDLPLPSPVLTSTSDRGRTFGGGGGFGGSTPGRRAGLIQRPRSPARGRGEQRRRGVTRRRPRVLRRCSRANTRGSRRRAPRGPRPARRGRAHRHPVRAP